MAMSIDATPAVGARHVIRSINDPPQIAALKLTITTFGTDVFESSEEIKGALGAMNGAVFPSVQVPEPFLEAYRNAHHSETEISYAFNAYICASYDGAYDKRRGFQFPRINLGWLFQRRGGGRISSQEFEGCGKILRVSLDLETNCGGEV